eukprot:2150675-Pyramimonas_sp.AAC.1
MAHLRDLLELAVRHHRPPLVLHLKEVLHVRHAVAHQRLVQRPLLPNANNNNRKAEKRQSPKANIVTAVVITAARRAVYMLRAACRDLHDARVEALLYVCV